MESGGHSPLQCTCTCPVRARVEEEFRPRRNHRRVRTMEEGMRAGTMGCTTRCDSMRVDTVEECITRCGPMRADTLEECTRRCSRVGARTVEECIARCIPSSCVSLRPCRRVLTPVLTPVTTRTMVVVMVTVLLCLGPAQGQSSPPVWAVRPRPTSVRAGGTVTLPCRFTDLADNQIAWLRDGRNYFVDGTRWSAPARFNVTRAQDNSGFDLLLTGALEEDDSVYTCQLQSGTLTADAGITVLVPPNPPTITLNNTSLTDGDHVTLTCESARGNPPPEITWYRQISGGSREKLTDGQTTDPDAKFGVTSSVVIRKVSRSDHVANYTCLVENEANRNAPRGAWKQLAVKYAPLLTVGPSDETGTRLAVVEGVSVSLTCAVDANPPSIEQWWEKNGNRISGAPSYVRIGKENAGIYTCAARNVINVAKTNIVLDVQYTPIVKVASANLVDHTIRVSEGMKVNLSCTVEANPPIIGSVQWKDQSGDIINWGSNYVMDTVNRGHAGNYTCVAENQLEPTDGLMLRKEGSEGLSLIVEYPPGKATITGPNHVLKDEPVTLRCTVSDPGIPAAHLEWTRLGDPTNQVIARDTDLTFSSAKLANNSDYICKPTNKVNDGEPDTFRLVVNEKPEWFGPSGKLPSEKIVPITRAAPLSVECRARGRPLPQVRWYKDDDPVGDQDALWRVESRHEAVDVHSYLVTSVLTWRGANRKDGQRLRMADAGRYSCRFRNDHDQISSDMMLTVQYAPVLNVTADKVATDINQTAILTCHAHAVPAPIFIWYNGTSRITNNSRVTVTAGMTSGEYPHMTSLNVTDVTADDLGQYRCEGVNTLGRSSLPIFLTVRTWPDPPTHLQVVSRTWESVELSWVKGFDGGYPQSFYVCYTSSRQNNTRVRVRPEDATKYNLTGLYPSVTYTFKVFGENQLGGGDYSANVSTVTDGFPIEPPTEVFYHLETRTLTFRSPSTNYCVLIEVYDNVRWAQYAHCASPIGGSIKIKEGVFVADVRIALCLQRRKDVCSDLANALIVKPPEDDLSVGTIVIVACVCGAVVLVLLVILIVLCCRRHRARKKEYDNELSNRSNHVMTPSNHGKKMNGIDNPSMDPPDIDMGDMSSRPSGSQPVPTNANYVMFDRRKGGPSSNGYPPMNGGPGWGRTEHPHMEPPPDYREVEQENRGNAQMEYVAMHKGRRKPKQDQPDGHDSGYVPDHLKEGSDSGVSTPDPTKPKKVIYEVIV